MNRSSSYGTGAAGSLASAWPKRLSAALVLLGLLATSPTAYGQFKDGSELTLIPAPAGWKPTDHVQYAFTPNDPYYATGNPVGFPGQWHLAKQTSGAAFDANLIPAWNRDLTGQGVTIGIVDDGLQHTHPDLNPNYVVGDSFDFGEGNADPAPVNPNTFPSGNFVPGDNHGTSVAGVAAARGGNGIGGTGAAPLAGLAGLRVDFPNQTDQMFIDATLFHSSGANTNIQVKNHSYGTSIPFIDKTAQANALITSHNAGTIHVFAAGNEGSNHGAVIDVNNNSIFDEDVDVAVDGDANKKHLQSLQETITVAALGSSGLFATYSNWGSNVWVTAPSNSFRVGEFGVTTTDRLGGANDTGGYNFAAGGGADGDTFPDLDYTSTFGGTSSAAPLVAGVMALGKQAQPNLNTRFAKHLLARTSVVVDPLDATYTGGWVTNGAGYNFNENYGFGLIDADAFTSEAVQFNGVTPLVTETLFQPMNAAIPDGDLNGISDTFSLTGLDPLEEVEIHLDVAHTWRGDIEAYLQSPSGTISRLLVFNVADSFNVIDWTFVSNAFWGEIPAGDWTLTVRDVIGGDVGTWLDYDVLAKMGDLIAIPEPASLLMASFGLVAFVAVGRGRGRRRR